MADDWEPLFSRSGLDQVCTDAGLLRRGDKVRLHPLARADIFDLALDGKIATIESIEQDLEDRIYLAVIVDDDPGRDLGRRLQPGHRFFFGIDEVEPVAAAPADITSPACELGGSDPPQNFDGLNTLDL
jgi:hypothetical protein